jgi:site-specific DNA-methyltransferase (adenine-specific)/adenine-specific DNA-methyltransferase
MVELSWRGKDDNSEENGATHGLRVREIVAAGNAQTLSGDQLTGNNYPQGWHNKLIQGDRAHVLAALLPEFAGRVDLIYIDPPFMTGRAFSSGTRLAYNDTWGGKLDNYLQWLSITLQLLYQLLAADGSLYVHLDWRVVHYARVMLDQIFAVQNHQHGGCFQNEIIWHYQSGGRATQRYARKHDTILFYTKSAEYCFHGERIGKKRGKTARNHMRQALDANGQVSWSIRSNGREYTYSEESLLIPSDVWSDISHLHQRDPERNGYATQKPAALLERVLLASSEQGDLVLDCFCGSGVTPSVAERLGRRWLAADQSDLAIETTLSRLSAVPERLPFELLDVVVVDPA